MNKLLLQEFANFKYEKPIDAEGKPRLSKYGNLLVKGIIQRADALNQNGRIYPKYILEKEVNNYMTMVKERRATGELDHCLPGTTEVLTLHSGWKPLSLASEEDSVATINTESGKVEFQQVNKKINVDYSGYLYKVTNGKKMSVTATDQHKHLLWDRSGKPYKLTSEELEQGFKAKSSKLSHSHFRATGIWEGNENEQMIAIPNSDFTVNSKTWFALLGFWLAEGYVSGSVSNNFRHKKIGITQKKQKNIEEIKKLLAKTGWNWRLSVRTDGTHDWTLSSVPIWNYFKQFGNSKQKFIPRELLAYDTEHLNIMLDWLLLGDGRNRHCNLTNRLIKEYSTVSKQLVEDVSELMFRLGYRPFIKEHQPGKDFVINGRVVPAENCSKIYTASANISKTYLDARMISVSKEWYSGEVHCVQVQNHNFLARENGYVFWTGNCDSPVVNLQNVSHVITEIWWEGNDLWGEIEVLEDLDQGKNLKGLLKNEIKVGISSRALGSVQKQGEANIVQDDLYLVCWDIVSEPSTQNAFMMHESKEYTSEELSKFFSKSDRLDRIANEVLSIKKE